MHVLRDVLGRNLAIPTEPLLHFFKVIIYATAGRRSNSSQTSSRGRLANCFSSSSYRLKWGLNRKSLRPGPIPGPMWCSQAARRLRIWISPWDRGSIVWISSWIFRWCVTLYRPCTLNRIKIFLRNVVPASVTLKGQLFQQIFFCQRHPHICKLFV